MPLTWIAWKGGKHSDTGAGYGFKVPIIDRDIHFKHEWPSVTLELPCNNSFAEVVVNIQKASFWNNTCHEVINKKIGLWLFKSSLAPWPKRKPPKIFVEVIGERRFRILTT